MPFIHIRGANPPTWIPTNDKRSWNFVYLHMAITPGKIEVVQPKMYVVSRLYQVIIKKIASKSDTGSAKGNWVQIRYTECICSTVYLDRIAWASFFSLSFSLRSRMSSSGSFLKFLRNSWLVASDSTPFVNSSDSFRVIRHAFFGPLLGPSILSFHGYKLNEIFLEKNRFRSFSFSFAENRKLSRL